MFKTLHRTVIDLWWSKMAVNIKGYITSEGNRALTIASNTTPSLAHSLYDFYY